MIALIEAECCALAGPNYRSSTLRLRASRPQLKRDPLDGRYMSIRVKAAVRWIILVAVLFEVSFNRHLSPATQWALGVVAALLLISAFFWPRCVRCGARAVRFNTREWIPDATCWRCGRAYAEPPTIGGSR